MEKSHARRRGNSELMLNDKQTELSTRVSKIDKSQYSEYSAISMRSKQRSNISLCSSKSKAHLSVRGYSKPLLTAQSFCSVEEAKIQHASVLRDYQIATNDLKHADSRDN